MSVWWKFLGGSVWAGGCIVLASACSGPGRDYSSATAGSGGSGDSSGGATASGGSSGSGAESSGGTDAVVGGAGGAPPDESCTAGDMQTCYESPDGESFGGKPPADQMTCRLGARKCLEDGTWEACVGAVAPLEADTCEPGNDSNCNGVPNEGCACTNGDKRACGSAVGNCKQGEQVCANSMWGECVGEIKPAATDTCEEGDDANCNDKLNEGCACLNGKTKDCGTDVGPCEFGKLTCLNGVWPGPEQCVGGIKPAAADTCEPGNDANCNQAQNENCKCTGSGSVDCGLNVGACKYGKQTCTGGVLSACTGGVNPTINDTCFADNAANDTNCNGHGRDGCSECVGGETGNCNECGTKACDGATGKFKACVGIDTTPPRCNPSDPTKRQVCGSSGVYVAGDCTATQQCTGQGVCKTKDTELCSVAADCASGVCNQFYADADGDTYRANSTVVLACGTSKPGHVLKALAKAQADCAGGDTNATVFPGAPELCDGLDNDCDGAFDREDDKNLPLGGISKLLAAGTYASVASSGALYGISYYNGPATKVRFAVVDQANAVQFKDKDVGANPGYWASRTATAWNTSTNNFGIFYGGALTPAVSFKKATTNGTITPATAIEFGTAGGNPSERLMATAMAGQGWMVVSRSQNYGNFSYGWKISAADAPTALSNITETSYVNDVATSGEGTSFGIVSALFDSSSYYKLMFSPRNTAGAESKVVAALDNQGCLSFPVIARRPAGGFAIMYRYASGCTAGVGTLGFIEIAADGTKACGPVYLNAPDWTPHQMVPTKRGFLAAGRDNGNVELQEVLNGCAWATAYDNIAAGVEPRLAAGTAGFALTWDDGSTNVYSRTFDSNICHD